MPFCQRRLFMWFRLLVILMICSGVVRADLPAVAFFYGANPPWVVLQSFDLVVVDPGHVPDPRVPLLKATRLAAYVAVGEVQPSRTYAAKLPKDWLVGDNAAWGSRVVDQSAPGWPAFFANEVIAPLWSAGYRDFFLDTLDSYHLVARNDAARAKQEAGLVAVIRAVKARFPEARLIFNRSMGELSPLQLARLAGAPLDQLDFPLHEFFPDRDTPRHADQFSIFELHAGAFIAVVEQRINSRCLALVVDSYRRFAQRIIANVYGRDHDIERCDCTRKAEAVDVVE